MVASGIQRGRPGWWLDTCVGVRLQLFLSGWQCLRDSTGLVWPRCLCPCTERRQSLLNEQGPGRLISSQMQAPHVCLKMTDVLLFTNVNNIDQGAVSFWLVPRFISVALGMNVLPYRKCCFLFKIKKKISPPWYSHAPKAAIRGESRACKTIS